MVIKASEKTNAEKGDRVWDGALPAVASKQRA